MAFAAEESRLSQGMPIVIQEMIMRYRLTSAKALASAGI